MGAPAGTVGASAAAGVQRATCNVRVQLRVQLYYTVSPTDSSPIQSSAT